MDVLFKRVWMIQRTVITAGGGPSVTYMRVEGEDEWFPGFLGSVGGSYWLGKHRWGILAEVDAGGSLEADRFVPEVEFATGLMLSL